MGETVAICSDAVADANARSAPSCSQMMALEQGWKSSQGGAALVETHTNEPIGVARALVRRRAET